MIYYDNKFNVIMRAMRPLYTYFDYVSDPYVSPVTMITTPESHSYEVKSSEKAS